MLDEKTIHLLEEEISHLGYELFEAKYHPGKNATLSIVVDRVTPISLEDIVKVSESLSSFLDEINPIEEAYTLDVSSAGAEKPIKLEKLPSYIGQYVHLHLAHPVEGENILEGTLESIEEGRVTLSYMIKTRQKKVSFPLEDIDAARLAIAF